MTPNTVVLEARTPVPSTMPVETHQRLVWWAKALSWLSLLWMTIEGVVAILAGLAAGSVALFGFGLDSAIEGMASVIVIWRFTGSRVHSEHAELRAQRLVGVSFFLLAPVVAIEAVRTIISADQPSTSWVGMALMVGSLIFMPVLGIAKQRIGQRLGSIATKGEGTQNMLCAYLAFGVLIGLIANTAVGWWWFDPVVALVISVVAVLEGRKAWRGEDCGCVAPVVGDINPCTEVACCDHD